MKKYDNNLRMLTDYKGDRIPTFKSVFCREDKVYCLKEEATWVPSRFPKIDTGFWRHPNNPAFEEKNIKWYNKGKLK
jgi:hypothetical protein